MDPEEFATVPLVVFDLETTGLCRSAKARTGAPDEIVQVCATALAAGDRGPGERFAAFCRPGVRANYAGLYPARPGRRPTSFDVHGIGAARVRGCDTWARVGERFREFVERCAEGHSAVVLVAYNGWAFDGAFLAANNRFHEVGGFSKPTYMCDPLRVAKSLVAGSRTLCAVHKKLFDEEVRDAHDAGADVAALVRVCRHAAVAGKLWEACKRFGTLEALAGAGGAGAPPPRAAVSAPPAAAGALKAPAGAPEASAGAPEASAGVRGALDATPAALPVRALLPPVPPGAPRALGPRSERCGRCGRVCSTFFAHECAPRRGAKAFKGTPAGPDLSPP